MGILLSETTRFRFILKMMGDCGGFQKYVWMVATVNCITAINPVVVLLGLEHGLPCIVEATKPLDQLPLCN